MATGKANNVGLPLEDGEAIQAGQYQLQDDDQIIEQVVEDSEEESYAEEEGNGEVERVEDTEDEEVGEVERVEDTEDEEVGEVERVEDTEDEENGEDEWVEDTEDEGGEVERVEDTEDEEDSEEDTMKEDGHNYTDKKEESDKEEQVKRDDGTAAEEEDEQVKKDNRNIQEDKDQSSEEEKDEEEEEEDEEDDIDGEEDEQVFDNEEEEEKVDEKTIKEEESDDGEEEEGEGEESEEEKHVKVDGERINLEDESAKEEEEQEEEEEEEEEEGEEKEEAAAAELPRKDGPIFLASKVNSKRKRVVADPQCSKKQRLLVTSVIGSRLSNPISLSSNLKNVQSCCISRKRSRENEDAVMKRRDNGDGDQKKTNKEGKKVLVSVGRRFTPEEEIALLEGMIDYVTMKGRNPKSNVRAFHKFMIERHNLSSDISAKQLKNKMRKLCKKHKAIKENNKESRKKGRRVNSMTQHHQGRVLELLNKFWEIRTSPTPKRMMAATADPSARGGYSVAVDALLDFIPNTNCNVTAAGGGGGGGKAEAEVVIDEQFLKQGLKMVGEEEREALEERWKKLRRKELGIKLERASLAHDSAMAILHAISG